MLPGLLPRRRAFRPVPSSLPSSRSASLAERCGRILFPRHALFASAGSGVGRGAFGTGSPPSLRPGDGGDFCATGSMEGSLSNRDLPCGTPGGEGGSVPGHLSWDKWMEHCCECSWGGMDGWWLDGFPAFPPLRLSPQPLEERSGIGPRLGGRAGSSASSGRVSASFSCSWP